MKPSSDPMLCPHGHGDFCRQCDIADQKARLGRVVYGDSPADRELERERDRRNYGIVR